MKEIRLLDGTKEFVWFDNDRGVSLRKFAGFEYPSTRVAIEDFPQDGSHYIDSKFGRRRLSWEGSLIDDLSVIPYQTILAKRVDMTFPMKQGGLKLLKFITYDNRPLQTEVEIERVTMPYTHEVHFYLIEAVAPDWRFFSQTLQTPFTGVTVFGGGTPIPYAIPSPIGGATETPLIINNDGNEVTSPVFHIRGPGSNFTVRNLTTNRQFNIQATLTAAETIIVDTKNKTVRKGNQNLFNTFSGNFWLVNPGNNLIRFTASGSQPETRLTVQFRSAFRGV